VEEDLSEICERVEDYIVFRGSGCFNFDSYGEIVEL